MTVNSNEQPLEGQANVNEVQGESNGHPAWQEILDAVPDSLHGILRPTLEKWDKGVQEKIQTLHQKYDPYKDFVEQGINPQIIQQSLGLVNQLEADPEAVIAQAIAAFGLDYVKKSLEEADDEDDDEFFGNEGDVSKDPRYKAMEEAVTTLQSKFEQQQQAELEAQQNAQFEEYLESLQKEHGQFDEHYVTALIAQGVDGAEAVKQYHTTINQAAAQLASQQQGSSAPTPPIVMGGDGTTGSGIPEKPINFGSMKNSDVNQLVADMIQRQSES